MPREKLPMVYNVTFVGKDGQDLHKDFQKVISPMERGEMPRELYFMQATHEHGLDPLSYKARLLSPAEAQKAIRQDKRRRIIESVQGQFLKQLGTETVDDFMVVDKLQRQGTV